MLRTEHQLVPLQRFAYYGGGTKVGSCAVVGEQHQPFRTQAHDRTWVVFVEAREFHRLALRKASAQFLAHEVRHVGQDFSRAGIDVTRVPQGRFDDADDFPVADNGNGHHAGLEPLAVVHGQRLGGLVDFHSAPHSRAPDDALIQREASHFMGLALDGFVGLGHRATFPRLGNVRPRVHGALIQPEAFHTLRSNAPQDVFRFDAVENALREGLEHFHLVGDFVQLDLHPLLVSALEPNDRSKCNRTHAHQGPHPPRDAFARLIRGQQEIGVGRKCLRFVGPERGHVGVQVDVFEHRSIVDDSERIAVDHPAVESLFGPKWQ